MRCLGLFLALALFLAVGAQLASAEPANITKAKRDAAALQKKLSDLGSKLEAASEEYNTATEDLKQINSAAKTTQAKIDKATTDLDTVDQELANRLVDIYKQGRLSYVVAFMDASSLTELIESFSLLERMSRQDADLVKRVGTYKKQIEQHKTELAQEAKQQKAYTQRVAAAEKKVQSQLATNKRLLKGKDAQIAQLEKDYAAKQAALKAQAEAAARAAAARAAAARAQPGHIGVSVPGGASGSKVVQVAMKYIGVPYVWAGASPSGFDCSGLVLYSYAQVGVHLPHSAAMQYRCGTPLSKNELQPGDLVFFYNPIHHVGIYVGNGNMINAPYTGARVRIESVWKSSYYGACRIL
jgi:peptidoglycan DL-endopeptidase CwlO